MESEPFIQQHPSLSSTPISSSPCHLQYSRLRQAVPRPSSWTLHLTPRLGEAQRHPRALTPVESLFDPRSDISSTIRRLRERWDGLRQEPQTLLALTPVRPQTSLDDMMAELLRPPQPPGPPQIQPPPAFIPLTYWPDARGLRPRSASPTLLTELPPIRPSSPLLNPSTHLTRDLGHHDHHAERTYKTECAGTEPIDPVTPS
ncbi:hypothetical protein F5888DRAFT_1801705 [Russula emetica]|nr:hypothetical protein F5888DRAFT_1801705 [Russula emetica]